MPNSPTRRARLSASSRPSSSPQARSGPDSSQHAIHCARSGCSLPGKKKGAPGTRRANAPTLRKEALSGEPDVWLGHHLLGNVLELRRFPPRLARGARLFEVLLLTGLSGFDRLLQFAHLRSLTG